MASDKTDDEMHTSDAESFQAENSIQGIYDAASACVSLLRWAIIKLTAYFDANE